MSNGGHIVLGKSWAKHLLSRIGYVKRRGSTAAEVAVSNYEELKQQFLLNIKVVVELEEIPSELVIIGTKQVSTMFHQIYTQWKR